MKVTAIIPTKNRPRELALSVRTLLAQSSPAASLVIIDQSPGEESRLAVQAAFDDAQRAGQPTPVLDYIHDISITGGAMARNRAMDRAEGDVWLFLDDDVVLEADFLAELLAVYRAEPQLTGVSGVITNYHPPPLAFRVWSLVFHCGPFHDDRQPVYWNAHRRRSRAPVRVTRFGGGLMSFRAAAIRHLRFDEHLVGVSDGEDVDFCSRLPSGSLLAMAPAARLEHRHSPSGRLQDHWLRRTARGELFLYWKNWNRGVRNRLACAWLLTGYGAVAMLASLRRWSAEPWRALATGLGEAWRSAHARSGA